MTAWSVRKRKKWARAALPLWLAVGVAVYVGGDAGGLGSAILDGLIAGVVVIAVLLLLALVGRRTSRA